MNLQTGQHAVGVVGSLDTHGSWMEENAWEEEILSGGRDQESDVGGELPSVPLRKRKSVRKVIKKRTGGK